MKKRYWLFILMFLFAFSSCRKIINLKVTDTDPKLVIEGVYDATNEEVKVIITETINVFSSDTFPTILGATVEIFDAEGIATLLNDNGDGTYTLEGYAPNFNSLYRMKVQLENGEIYEAEDFLPKVVEIDSLTWEYTEQTFFSEEGYLVYMHGSDPPGERNYYRLIQKINGEYKEKFGEQILFDDELADGSSIKLTLFGSIFEYEDTVAIEVRSLSEATYTYTNSMMATAGGSQFSAAPANPESNWVGPNECLGYFSVYGFSSDSLIVGH